MLKMLKDRIKTQKLTAPVALASATVKSATFDLQDVNSFCALVETGAFSYTGSNKVLLSLQESDDDTTYTAVAAANIAMGNGAAAAESDSVLKTYGATLAADDTLEVHYRGVKRYVQVWWTVSGTVTSLIGAQAVASYLEEMGPALSLA